MTRRYLSVKTTWTAGRFDRQDPAKYMTGDDVDGGNFKDYSSGDTYDGGTFANMANYWHIYSLSSLTVSTDDVVITGIRVTAADGDDVDGRDGAIRQ